MGVVLPQPVQFGKYSLFERIGRGGMADVFKGRVQGPAGFERVFVVKRILPHLSDDPTFNRMFVEEAKLSARLNHPNIVQVFELGSVENEYFISMEYVRGRDLSETMRTLWARVGPPRPELVAYVGREMCRALAYAHDLTADDGTPLGMIHRDISPSNVMLSYEGAVKILDFGIAKALGSEPEQGNTKSGTLKGKFAYMAPEQTQSGNVDKRIDIFATGIVLHEVLTGRRLFKGENDLQTVERVRVCDVPAPSLQNPLCPPELDGVVLKALAKRPDDRFQSAAEMAESLDDIVHAARFAPSHLAQLMRELFPGDLGPGEARAAGTGSRPSQSMSTAGSRPHSNPSRSPTLPPVSRTSSAIAPVPPQDRSAPAPRPLWKRASVWGTMMLLAVAFAGGMMLTKMQARHDGHFPGVAVDDLRPRPSVVLFQSDPDRAEVFDQLTKQKLGETPFSLNLPFSEQSPMLVVFKKAGYQDEIRRVDPHRPMAVTLKPEPAIAPAPSTPAVQTELSAAARTEERPAASGPGVHRRPSRKTAAFPHRPASKLPPRTRELVNPF